MTLQDVIIDSRATCNLMGEQRGNASNLKEFNTRQRKRLHLPMAGGCCFQQQELSQPLSSDSETICETDFVVVKGDSRSLL